MSDIDEDLIISLSKLLDKTGLSEIEIENKIVGRVKVAKNNYQPTIAMAADLNKQDSNPSINNSEESNEIKNAVLSPMVGTIYLRPDPESPTFINEGDKVKKGQTLLIIEAMKTMNNISAENDGTVKKILVKNEQPIQFDEPLLIIE